MSYYGRYEVRGGKVIHQVEVSLNHNMTGRPVERFIQPGGKRLFVSMPPFPLFGEADTGHLVWERV